MDHTSRQVLVTADGSPTLALPDLGITYHSRHGATQESNHVFIQAGLQHYWEVFPGQPVRIWEAGLGTGLNALMTWLAAEQQKISVTYVSAELFPLEKSEYEAIHFESHLTGDQVQEKYRWLHEAEWETWQEGSAYFRFKKMKMDFRSVATHPGYDLIYYDAFAPGAQPELWTPEQFARLYASMNSGGRLVTYCSKGDVRRAMIHAGFSVEKIPGPPGKREMLRAVKS